MTKRYFGTETYVSSKNHCKNGDECSVEEDRDDGLASIQDAQIQGKERREAAEIARIKSVPDGHDTISPHTRYIHLRTAMHVQ